MALESDAPIVLTECRVDDDDCDKNGSINGEINRGEELKEQIEDESEDEDEDVDFNPLLKESPSEEEASSSLSSEVEGVDTDAVESRHCSTKEMVLNSSEIMQRINSDHDSLGCSVVDSRVDDKGAQLSHEEPNKSSDRVSILERENVIVQEKENGGFSSGIDAIEDSSALAPITMNSKKPVIDLDVDDDDDDAICKRTRARYSLASFTLDELETFLQESDDDDDFQNVDEEEEYRKFLAAVLQGVNGDEGNLDGNDDDEDNDADFEIEIEEALESDVDDCVITSKQNEEFVRSSRRPETRQNRRQKSNVQNKKKIDGKETRQLRPLLPVMPSAPVTSPHFSSCLQDHPLKGFVVPQIGQLYSLIYEHVQLLIQIYSLCVLEPSRQHIASQIKGLLSELLHKRDLVLAWRSLPYPSSCFVPQYVHSIGSNENRTCPPIEDSGASSQGNGSQGCGWLPSVGGPVLSVLDVAPLKLVGKYFEDVSNAIREHQRRCVENSDIYLDKQPLFPLPICPPLPESNQNVSKGDVPTPPDSSGVSPNTKVPKKTLAATLVESTKKQSVAFVSRQIAKVAQPFYSLFNPALFPHKPPSSAVANRVLFTDTEDELLAMGMMEYNNDWKAIKQRFLPCKSEHQIFVRAKNRCSSKAPENPIKAVRKMKTSPLTDEEKARIHEGLKTFKLDWMAIWKFIVPYRDPNLLCRQWRIANGIQKSYKADSLKKEKRRIYESNRRKVKAAAMENSLTESEEDDPTEYCGGRNGSGEDCVENDNEAYLHEAFLADWRPTSSGTFPSKVAASSFKSRCLPGDSAAERFSEIREGTDNHWNQESQSVRGHICELSAAPEGSYLTHCKTFQPCMLDNRAPSKSIPMPIVSEAHLHPHRARKRSVPNLVKLAPELPPVKLPSAVRVIPQAFLRTSQLGPSAEGASSGSGHQNILGDHSATNCSSNLVKAVQDRMKMVNATASSMSSQRCGLQKNGCLTKEGGLDLDPQMHPLLFQTIEEGPLPYCPSSSRIPTFSFFPAAQNQITVNLLQNPCSASPVAARSKSSRSKETAPNASSLDFHPLLQRPSDAVSSAVMGPTDPMLSTDLELSRDGFMGDGFANHAVTTADQMASANRPTTRGTNAIDLDLDIHLNSASRKRKVPSYEGAEVNLTVPSVSATEFIQGEKGRIENHGADNCPADPFTSGSTSSATLVPSLDGSSVACTNDNVGDQSLLGIVMEQEELSDSDEEMEGVEFECEEMTDSEGEGSDNEHIFIAQNEEQANIATNGQGASEGICAQRQTPSSDLVDPGKGSSRSSWLSLNSRGSHCSQQSGTSSKHLSSEGVPAQSNPSRYSKKATSSTRITTPGELVTDVSQPGPISPPSRKSRKQTFKNPSSLRTDLSVGTKNCIGKDKKV